MKASDLIERLQKAVAEHGDLELLFTGNYGERTFRAPKLYCHKKHPLWPSSARVIELVFDLGS